MSIYISRQDYQRDLLPEFRDFKLKLIQSDIEFSVSKEVIKKYHTDLTFIRNNFKNDIISGSIALSLLGLINRVASDIDILIKDKNRYSGYINILDLAQSVMNPVIWIIDLVISILNIKRTSFQEPEFMRLISF